MKTLLTFAAVIATVLTITSVSSAASADLDLVWGDQGVARITGRMGELEGIIRQANGKTVILFRGPHPHLNTHWPMLVRFGTDGEIDPTFGIGGKRLLPNWHDGYGILSMPDLRLLTTADTSTYTEGSAYANNDSILRKYTKDGDPSPTWGTNGTRIYDFANQADVRLHDSPCAQAVDPNGNLVLEIDTAHNPRMVRLLPDGDIDTSFGILGFVDLPDEARCDMKSQFSIGADGSITVIWNMSGLQEGDASIVVSRYTSSGLTDTTFGGTGSIVINHSGQGVSALGTATDSSGNVFVYGQTGTADPLTCPCYGRRLGFIAKYGPDGLPVSSFGDNGFKSFSLGTRRDAIVEVQFVHDGKLMVSGTTERSFEFPISFVMRLNADGSPDESYTTDGIIYVPASGGTAGPTLLMLPDGRFLVGTSIDATPQRMELYLFRGDSADVSTRTGSVANVRARAPHSTSGKKTVSFIVRNKGPRWSNRVRSRLRIPYGLQVISARAPNHFCSIKRARRVGQMSAVRCNLGKMGPNGRRAIRVTVRLVKGYEHVMSTLVAGGTTPDARRKNNTARLVISN